MCFGGCCSRRLGRRTALGGRGVSRRGEGRGLTANSLFAGSGARQVEQREGSGQGRANLGELVVQLRQERGGGGCHARVEATGAPPRGVAWQDGVWPSAKGAKVARRVQDLVGGRQRGGEEGGFGAAQAEHVAQRRGQGVELAARRHGEVDHALGPHEVSVAARLHDLGLPRDVLHAKGGDAVVLPARFAQRLLRHEADVALAERGADEGAIVHVRCDPREDVGVGADGRRDEDELRAGQHGGGVGGHGVEGGAVSHGAVGEGEAEAVRPEFRAPGQHAGADAGRKGAERRAHVRATSAADEGDGVAGGADHVAGGD